MPPPCVAGPARPLRKCTEDCPAMSTWPAVSASSGETPWDAGRREPLPTGVDYDLWTGPATKVLAKLLSFRRWRIFALGALDKPLVAAREAIGSPAGLFVDANGAYDRKEALAKAAAFSQFGVSWSEEPVSFGRPRRPAAHLRAIAARHAHRSRGIRLRYVLFSAQTRASRRIALPTARSCSPRERSLARSLSRAPICPTFIVCEAWRTGWFDRPGSHFSRRSTVSHPVKKTVRLLLPPLNLRAIAWRHEERRKESPSAKPLYREDP